MKENYQLDLLPTPSSFKNTVVVVKDKCYEATKVKVKENIQLYFWLNIFFFPGVVVDYLDGEMWKLEKEVVINVNKKLDCK